MLANREPYEADAFCPGCWICEITSLRPNTPCALGSGATRPGIITRACEHGPGGKSSGPAPPWSRLTCSTAGQQPPAGGEERRQRGRSQRYTVPHAPHVAAGVQPRARKFRRKAITHLAVQQQL